MAKCKAAALQQEPTPYVDIPQRKKVSIMESLLVTIEVDFIRLSKSGDTNIRFIDINYYTRSSSDTPKLLLLLSYKHIKDALEFMLSSEYVLPTKTNRASSFTSVTLPVGASILGE